MSAVVGQGIVFDLAEFFRTFITAVIDVVCFDRISLSFILIKGPWMKERDRTDIFSLSGTETTIQWKEGSGDLIYTI